MANIIGGVWTFLSVSVACLATFGLLEPYWLLENQRSQTGLGLFSYCSINSQILSSDLHLTSNVNLHESNKKVPQIKKMLLDIQEPPLSLKQLDLSSRRLVCNFYGVREDESMYFSISNLPGWSWQVTFLLALGGCLLQVTSAGISIVALFCQPYRAQQLAAYTSGVQVIGVLLNCIALILFPTGFSSSTVQRICGPDVTSYYHGPECQLGWAYLLYAMANTLAIFCPVLGHLHSSRMCQKRTSLPEDAPIYAVPDETNTLESRSHFTDGTIMKSTPANRLSFTEPILPSSQTSVSLRSASSIGGFVDFRTNLIGGSTDRRNRMKSAPDLAQKQSQSQYLLDQRCGNAVTVHSGHHPHIGRRWNGHGNAMPSSVSMMANISEHVP